MVKILFCFFLCHFAFFAAKSQQFILDWKYTDSHNAVPQPYICDCPTKTLAVDLQNFPYIGINWLDDIYQELGLIYPENERLFGFLNFDFADISPYGNVQSYNIGSSANFMLNEQQQIMQFLVSNPPNNSDLFSQKFRVSDFANNYCADGKNVDNKQQYPSSIKKYEDLLCLHKQHNVSPSFDSRYLTLLYDSGNVRKYRYYTFLHTHTRANEETTPFFFPEKQVWNVSPLAYTDIEVSLNNLNRPIEKRFYLAGQKRWLTAYVSHSYGATTDTQRYYQNLDLTYLRQPIKTHTALFFYKNSKHFSQKPDTGNVLLTTSIYQDGKLKSLHHDYLKKIATENHAVAYLAALENPYSQKPIPIVLPANFTYTVSYNEVGEINEINAVSVSYLRILFDHKGIGLLGLWNDFGHCAIRVSYSDFDRQKNWQKMTLFFGTEQEGKKGQFYDFPQKCYDSLVIPRSIEYRP